MQQAGGTSSKGKAGGRLMLIQILLKDYSRFGKVQRADLTFCLSVQVAMPATPRIYSKSTATKSRDALLKESE